MANMEKDIQDALSEAMSPSDERSFAKKVKDAVTNRVVGYQDVMSHYRSTGQLPDEYRKAKDPGKIRQDPQPPRKMGGEKLFQMPYKRGISKALGTKELPVGKSVPDRMKPAGSRHRSGNLTQRFSEGGSVRPGDVRDNPNRGKTY